MDTLKGLPNDIQLYIYKLIHTDIVCKLNYEYHQLNSTGYIEDATHFVSNGTYQFKRRHFMWNYRNLNQFREYSLRIFNINECGIDANTLPKRYIYSSCIDAKIYP